jgi:hypothetical protein
MPSGRAWVKRSELHASGANPLLNRRSSSEKFDARKAVDPREGTPSVASLLVLWRSYLRRGLYPRCCAPGTRRSARESRGQRDLQYGALSH